MSSYAYLIPIDGSMRTKIGYGWCCCSPVQGSEGPQKWRTRSGPEPDLNLNHVASPLLPGPLALSTMCLLAQVIPNDFGYVFEYLATNLGQLSNLFSVIYVQTVLLSTLPHNNFVWDGQTTVSLLWLSHTACTPCTSPDAPPRLRAFRVRLQYGAGAALRAQGRPRAVPAPLQAPVERRAVRCVCQLGTLLPPP